MFNVGVIDGSRAVKVPEGEVLIEGGAWVSGAWVCPPGVTSVCFVMLSAGGMGSSSSSGGNGSGGGGGAILYKNSHTTIPGGSYTYLITANRTEVFGFVLNAGSSSGAGAQAHAQNGVNGVVSFAGGNGATYGSMYGGGAARYDRNGHNGAMYELHGRTWPYGLPQPTASYFGYGGRNANGYRDPGSGFIRIMWGKNRSFPYSAEKRN